MSEKSTESSEHLNIDELPAASTVCTTCVFTDYNKDGIQIGCKADRLKYFENANIPMAQVDDGNTISIVIEGKWICGECLVSLDPAVKDAMKEYNKQQYTPKKYKVENTYNVTVDPTTGRLKRENFK